MGDTADAAGAEEIARRQQRQLEALNEKISGEQQMVESRIESSRELRRSMQRQRTADIEDLQQQIKDLELYLQMRKRCEASADPTDLQGSHIVVTEADGPRGRG